MNERKKRERVYTDNVLYQISLNYSYTKHFISYSKVSFVFFLFDGISVFLCIHLCFYVKDATPTFWQAVQQ